MATAKATVREVDGQDPVYVLKLKLNEAEAEQFSKVVHLTVAMAAKQGLGAESPAGAVFHEICRAIQANALGEGE